MQPKDVTDGCVHIEDIFASGIYTGVSSLAFVGNSDDKSIETMQNPNLYKLDRK